MEPWTITSRYDMENANSRAGFHFFEPSTMRFFRSRIGNVHPLPFGALFVTSEQFSLESPRYYTVRHMLPSGGIHTLGAFQQFATSAQANRFARKIAAWCKEGFDVTH